MARTPNLSTAIPQKATHQTEPEPQAKRFPNKKQATLYLDKPVHKALKLLAIEHETSVHALVLQGIDMVLQKHGGQSLKELTAKH